MRTSYRLFAIFLLAQLLSHRHASPATTAHAIAAGAAGEDVVNDDKDGGAPPLPASTPQQQEEQQQQEQQQQEEECQAFEGEEDSSQESCAATTTSTTTTTATTTNTNEQQEKESCESLNSKYHPHETIQHVCTNSKSFPNDWGEELFFDTWQACCDIFRSRATGECRVENVCLDVSSSGSSSSSDPTSIREQSPTIPIMDPCQNSHPSCLLWAREGECRNNPTFMLNSCARACGSCVPLTGSGNNTSSVNNKDGENEEEEPYMTTCNDNHESCGGWGDEGECVLNPTFMNKACKYSCWKCVDVRKDRMLGVHEDIIAKKLTYLTINTGTPQLIRGTDDISIKEHLHIKSTLRKMDHYAKHIITDLNFIGRKGRERCMNHLRMCGEWASRGMCSPFSPLLFDENNNYMEDNGNDDEDEGLGDYDDYHPSNNNNEQIVYMMNMCPLACRMCDEIESFHQCAGRRHPWSKRLFDDGGLNSFFEGKRKGIVDTDDSNNDSGSDGGSGSSGGGGGGWEKYNPIFASHPNYHEQEKEGGDNANEGQEDDPYVVVLQNFLSDEEANHLQALGSNIGWALNNNTNTSLYHGASCRNADAAATTTCNNDEIYQRVMDRIASLADTTQSFLEPMDLLQFGSGEYMAPHHHFEVNSIWKPAGPRVLSLFLFLSEVITTSNDEKGDEVPGSGGELGFPNLDWLFIRPQKGMVVLWSNVRNENLYKVNTLMNVEHFPVGKGAQLSGGYVHLRLYNWTDADMRGCA